MVFEHLENECNPRFLGVAVMHWARTMATELRDSRSGRRQGSSSDWRVPYGALDTLARAKRKNPSALIHPMEHGGTKLNMGSLENDLEL